MKKQILRLSGIIVVAALLVMNITFDSNTSAYDTVMDIVVSSALADGEGGDRIICKCTIWNTCRADGTQSVCAQSEPGGNIHCDDYDGNC